MPKVAIMEKPKYNIPVPIGFKIIRNEFYMYNPEKEYTEELNLYYLQEDLLQLIKEDKKIAVDLGWYGDIASNKGQYKIYVIKDMDWENPEQEIESTSSDDIYNKLVEMVNSLK